MQIFSEQGSPLKNTRSTYTRFVWLVFGAALLVSLGLCWWLHLHNQTLYAQRLNALTDSIEERVRERVGLYEYGLRGARGAVVAAGGTSVSREVFAAYMASRDLAREFPGARGFGFIRKVPRSQEAAFLASARAEGPADFAIRELSPHSGERYVIQYIYPLANNRGATGLDVASENNRRAAAAAAAQDAAVRITAPITLVQADDQPRQGFLAFLPVYARGTVPADASARESATIGWAYAPLSVNEVLGDFGPVLQEVGLQLSDAAESKPFFVTDGHTRADALASVPQARRTMAIFGRQWVLQTRALPALASAARPVPVAWVFAGLLAASAAISGLTWLVLRRRLGQLTNADEALARQVGLRNFLTSPLARWAALGSTAFLLVALVLSYRQLWVDTVQLTSRSLMAVVEDRADRLKTAQTNRRKTMLFLADVPPIQGLVRTNHGALDPLDGSTRQAWERRLQQIFAAHLRSSPEVSQARFIGVANGGRELVRVERRGRDVVVVPDTELQPKGDRPYLQQALALPPGEVLVSDLDLNRERGQLELPHRPTIRYATPIYAADGQIFGVVVVNVDVADRQAESAAAALPGGALYITNAAGDFLLHPDVARRFGFDLGQRHRWEDEFRSVAAPAALAGSALQSWQGAGEPVVVATAEVKPNAGSSVGRVRYSATLPQALLQRAVWVGTAQSAALPLAAITVAWLLLYFYWASVQRQLHVRDQQRRLATIVDQSGDAIIGLDAGMRVTAWNRGAQQLFGRSGDEAMGVPLAELIGSDQAFGGLPETVAGIDAPLVQEFDCRSRDGRQLRVAMSLSPLAAADGLGTAQASAVLRDVTEERAAQQRVAELNAGLEQQVQERTHSLAQERERLKDTLGLLRSVLDSATEVAIIATDAQGLITIFNAGAERLLGYRADELVGLSSPAPLHLPEEVGARGAELSAEFGMPIEGFRIFVHKAEIDGAERREWTYVCKDGTHVPVSLAVTAIRSEAGGITGYLGIAQNIAERRAAEAQLRHAKVHAEAANAAKSLFLANMSHEIRTPMNAVIGVAYLLEDTPLTDDQRQLLAKLQIAGRSLMGIINDVLDLSKIEAGEMRLEPAPMDPAALLHDMVQLFGPQAQAKGVELQVEDDGALPPQIIGDALRLRQVLVNLIGNALKFTAEGRVTVRARTESDAQGAWLRLAVQDTGLGMPPETLARLFQPFMQEDVSTTRRFGGTGLGLSIVRKLADLMQGQVGVNSQPGQGSEFWLRLPLVVADAADAGAMPPDTVPLHVLLVDDDDRDRTLLAGMCRGLGWRTMELSSGKALIQHCLQLIDTGQPLPEALLVDWQMGDIDGLRALEIVADRAGAQRMPAALIISAFERQAIAALDHAKVVDQILTKPVTLSQLFDAVNNAVAKHTGSTERVAGATRVGAKGARWLAGVRVLIVDDSDINLEVARRLLEREGAQVWTADSGAKALACLDDADAAFDAVLMDIQMPGMDGLEATRRIRQDPRLQELPVLALTAGALSEERRLAEAAGMNDFLTKPLDPQALVTALRRAVEAARGAPLPLGQHAPSAVPTELAAADWPVIDGIDGAAASSRMSHDSRLFLMLLERLLREFPPGEFDPAGDAAGDAAAAREPVAMAARLHKLRGSGGLLGAHDIHRLAGQAETALRAGATLEQTRDTRAQLALALQSLAAAARPVLVVRDAAALAAQSADGAAPQPVPDELLAELLSLLKQQDMAATELFQRQSARLRTLWGPERFAIIREAVENLEFDAALATIEDGVTR